MEELGAASLRRGEESRAATNPLLAPAVEAVNPLQLLEKLQELSNLNEIFALLPIGVSVETLDGDVLLANEAAATHLAGPAGPLPPASRSSGSLTEPLDQLQASESAPPVAQERCVLTDSGERTFLLVKKPVRIREETLLLSASLDITDRKQSDAELMRRANFDELTGLPNRFQLEEHVKLVLARPAGPFALAFIDIDDFKLVNDYYGHSVGDTLLTKISTRISEHIRATDLLARIGGDEFLLLIGPLDHERDLLGVINTIADAMKRPFFVDGFELYTSVSIGTSIYPEHGRDFETLRRSADSAMYQVKQRGKGGSAVFESNFDHFAATRMQSMQRLRMAIQDRRFRCAFQPKVNVYTEEVVGVEALVRLFDEDGEVHGPGSFIELAHELGVMDEMTKLVVEEISSSIDLINDAFGPRSTISVNVTAKQASNVDFMHSFIEVLKETNCPDRFIVEVTEDALASKSEFQTEVLPTLREIGVRVSIDDFGTGYSSLSSLADITADEIKIDRSFITDIHKKPRNQSIIKAIESLSSALGMTIVAEGVETVEELDYLRAASNIRYVQGYYFAKPLFLEDFKPAKRAASASGKNSRYERLNGRRRVYR